MATNSSITSIIRIWNESESEPQWCAEFPSKVFMPLLTSIVVGTASAGFLTNLLILASYSPLSPSPNSASCPSYNWQRKLSPTECFISFLALSDLVFSGSVLLFLGLDKFLLSTAENNCGLFKTQAFSHAFEQFLSWLLFLNISLERFMSICKVSNNKPTLTVFFYR